MQWTELSCNICITYWHRFTHEGVRVDTATDHDTIGGQFLSLLTGKEPSEEHARALDVSISGDLPIDLLKYTFALLTLFLYSFKQSP